MKSRIILNRERTAKAQEISIPIHGKGGELGIKAVTGLVGLIETLKDCGTCQEVQSVFDAICGYNACCIRCEFIDEKGADELMELVSMLAGQETKEEQKKVNTRAAERKLRLLLNANFGYGDYHLELDYIRKKGQPDRSREQMRKDMDIFLRELRKECKKAGIELKAGKNKATKNQEKWQVFLNDQGYYAVICYGWREAAKVIEEYLLKADNDKAAAVLQEMGK